MNVFFGVSFAMIILGGLQAGRNVWMVNPRLWHTDPVTEPVGMLVALVALVLATLVGAVVSWRAKRSR